MRRSRNQPLPIFDAVAALIPEQVLVSTDAEARVRVWSRGAERLFGYAADEIVGQPMDLLVPEDRRAERAEQIVAPVFAGETVRLKTVRLHRDGTRLDVHCVLFPLWDAGGERVVGVSSVSYHDADLSARDVPLRSLVEALPAPAVYREGDALYVNDAAAALTGYARAEVQTLGAWFEALFGDDAPTERALYEADRRTAWAEPRTVLVARRDGRQRFVEVVGYLSPRAEVWLLRDVTERRALERELLAVSEREQRRIGRDLHDGLGAHLTGVAMLCRTLARRLEKGQPVAPEEVGEVADLVQEGIATARSLARGLNPVAIESAGLAGALQELANGVELRTGVRCRLIVDQPAPETSVETATHLYRLAQEATANALRHSGTDEVVLALVRTDAGVALQILDRGCGLSLGAGGVSPGAGDGLGLHAMRYRAGFVGATLAVEARAGGGTVVSCTLPAP